MKKSKFAQFAIRVAVYCVGLLIIGFGVAFSVNSNLGVSPVNSLPYVVSQVTQIPMGTCVTAIFCVSILLQAIILRKDFQIINLLQIVFSSIFGYFVDFAKLVMGDFAIPTYPGKLLMLGISIFLNALGLVIYLEAQLIPMPMEGLTTTLAKKLGKPFPTMKSVIDCTIVVAGLVLCFVFLGRLDGLREGTVISAIAIGKMAGILKKWVSPIAGRLCFGEKTAKNE